MTENKSIPRVAVTIIYNGMHHLLHKGFVDFMLKNFDYWSIAEGHSRNGGSTWACNNTDLPASSTDGTIEYLSDLAKKNDKVLFYSKGKHYRSKDEQVNIAVMNLKKKLNFAYLWQVDVDEHWNADDLGKAEKILIKSGKKQAAFQFNHYVGKDIIAKGWWGDDAMPRLFIWRGQKFMQHEPPSMHPMSKTLKIEGIKFDHYSYYFPEDIRFKEQYYPDCKGMFSRWENLQKMTQFPQPITVLFPESTQIGKSNSKIIRL